MARPEKLNPDLQAEIVRLVAAGVTVEVAAQTAGISESTFYAWLKRGARAGAANAPYREFRDAIEQARASSEATLIARIATAAKNGSWSAAAFLLERRFPERWAKAVEKEHPPGASNPDEVKGPFDALDAGDELAPRRRARRKTPR